MNTLEFESLIRNVSDQLVNVHWYTLTNPTLGSYNFEAPSNSKFGNHIILFRFYYCYECGIPYRIGQPYVTHSNGIEAKISQFVDQNLSIALQNFKEEVKNGL
ncbi:hypothetical protein [Pedobacter agri]|uniref:hypothetical protein n=1 Tax=Pedobacter agri TaxID=454586 RepID=UPI00292E1425|nr:hypothetical protein [Pedobacter agri]